MKDIDPDHLRASARQIIFTSRTMFCASLDGTLDLEDLLQDLVEAGLKSIDKWDPEGGASLNTWIYRAMSLQASTLRRTAKRKIASRRVRKATIIALHDWRSCKSAAQASALAVKEIMGAVESSTDSEAVKRVLLKQEPVAPVAKEYGMHPDTLKKRVLAARSSIKRKLPNYFESKVNGQ